MGINFHLGHGGKSPLTILETAGCGGGFLDFNNDGWLDLLLIAEHRLALYKNEKGQRFVDVTVPSGLSIIKQPPASGGAVGRYWMGCAVGDYNNDGFADFYLSGYRCSALLKNDGDATFSDVSERAGVRNRHFWETSCTFTDVDGDGWLDLYVGRYVVFSERTVQFCFFQGVGAACPPHYYEPERGALYLNRGDGTFEEATSASGLANTHGKTLGVLFFDYDSDGDQDLYCANDGVAGDLFQNVGKGKFVNVGLLSGTAYTGEGKVHAGMGVDAADYDCDGDFDLIVTAFQHEGCTLYRNEGDGTFTDVTSQAGLLKPTLLRLGFGVKFADFDNDGFPDLLIANGHVQDTVARFDDTATYAQKPQLFWNTGKGNFLEVSERAGPVFQRRLVGRGVSVGDFDNDGRLDALLVDAEGSPLLLRNTTTRSGNWLEVQVVGKKSNRMGIGALVTLSGAGGWRMVKQVSTGGSYLSAQDGKVHFGLGHRRKVNVEVAFGNGRTARRDQVEANQVLVVVEPHASTTKLP